MFDWLYKMVVPDHKVSRAVPFVADPNWTDKQTELLWEIIRKAQAKRKIKRFVSLGVLPLRLYQCKKLQKVGVPMWIVRKLQ